MAFLSLSQTDRRARLEPAFLSLASASFRRLLAALAAAHHRRLGFEVARFGQVHGNVRPELAHALSWRFGVPVR